MHHVLQNVQPIRIFQRKTESRLAGQCYFILYISMLANEKEQVQAKEVLVKLLSLLNEIRPEISGTEAATSASTEAKPLPEEAKTKPETELVKYYALYKLKHIEDVPSKINNMVFCPSVASDIDTDQAYVFD